MLQGREGKFELETKESLLVGRWQATDILAVIGSTPLVRLGRPEGGGAEVWAKLESLNPAGSVKDRIARAMVEAAERSGELRPGGVIVEPTSGNTGIALAMLAAAKGYRLILAMPETMSMERRNLIRSFGAELVLTPASEGTLGAVKRAEALIQDTPGAFMPQQFKNPANPEVHRRTTAVEILSQTEGRVDAFVAGVGTGGTITGVGEVLKDRLPNVQVIAVEPARSPLLSRGEAGPHGLQGLGTNFIPEVLNQEVLDGIIAVGDEDAKATMLRLRHKHGVLVGVSSGAAAYAAFQVAAELDEDMRVITVLPDTGERYLSLTPAAGASGDK